MMRKRMLRLTGGRNAETATNNYRAKTTRSAVDIVHRKSSIFSRQPPTVNLQCSIFQLQGFRPAFPLIAAKSNFTDL